MATTEINTKSDIDKLKNHIEEMDHLSQDGFSKVSALANILSAALGNEKKPPKTSDLLPIFRQIDSVAQDHENLINCLAEEVGCNFKTGGAMS